jgi:hypothetical protein
MLGEGSREPGLVRGWETFPKATQGQGVQKGEKDVSRQGQGGMRCIQCRRQGTEVQGVSKVFFKLLGKELN